MLRVQYRVADRRAVLEWDDADASLPWLPVVRRLILDRAEDAEQEDARTLSLPWWNLAALRSDLLDVFRGFSMRLGADLIIDEQAQELLRQSRRVAETYEAAKTATPIAPATLQQDLKARGFMRDLSAEQLRNVGRIAALPAGATFSVPGAGKTTEALAYYTVRALSRERLLVIAPKNAFAAWDEQIEVCLPERGTFTRLRGGRDRITRALADDPKFMLITYQQLVRVSDIVAAHCAEHPTFVFLDESHRIKSGAAKQTARAVLNLSHLPAAKLIMSGTPMPQSVDDLIPQFTFLYPEVPSESGTVVDLMRPIYVRTTKTELGLPPVTRQLVQLSMAPLQSELYQLMKFEVVRQANAALSLKSKQSFRTLGRSVARLLQFVSNPALLAASFGETNADLLSGVLAEGEGPKLRYVLKQTRRLARQGHKVLVWSSFVRNVEYLAERLADVGAVYIHGGVDAGDEDDDETREGKIKLFHDDPNVRVMVANPAAASEGVSLHRVCHHAIYLDRTFNAAHYLQSEDRIHRFGLPPDQATTIEIVECLNSVDVTVRTRLDFKIGQMAQALNDPSLRPDPIPIDPTDIEDYEDYSTGLSEDDIATLLRDLSGAN